MDHQDSILEMLTRCMRCPDMCAFACPVFTTRKSQAVSPSNMAHNARMLYTQDIPDSSDVRDILYQCMGCRRCANWCIYDDIDLPGLITMVRAFAVRKFGEELIPEHPLNMKKNYLKHGSPYPFVLDEADIPIQAELQQKVSAKGEVLFFAGCTTKLFQPEIASAALNILDKLDVDYTYLGSDEPCCGAPLTDLGFFDVGKEAADSTARLIETSGCKQVLTACPQCAYHISSRMEQLGIALDVQVMHLTEFLANHAEEKQLKFVWQGDMNVCFDDDLYLARYLNLHDEPRQILAAMSGVNLVEMYYKKKEAFPGTAYRALPDITTEKRISERRFSEALLTGADILITASPLAKKTLSEAANEKMQVIDLIEFVSRRIE